MNGKDERFSFGLSNEEEPIHEWITKPTLTTENNDVGEKRKAVTDNDHDIASKKQKTTTNNHQCQNGTSYIILNLSVC